MEPLVYKNIFSLIYNIQIRLLLPLPLFFIFYDEYPYIIHKFSSNELLDSLIRSMSLWENSNNTSPWTAHCSLKSHGFDALRFIVASRSSLEYWWACGCKILYQEDAHQQNSRKSSSNHRVHINTFSDLTSTLYEFKADYSRYTLKLLK